MDINEKIKYVLEHLRDVPDEFKESTETMKKWLLKKDNEGYYPEIYVGMSNRTGGKTYFMAYLLLKLYETFGTKFVLEARTGTELGRTAEGIFAAVLHEFNNWSIEERIVVNNVYSEIYLTYEHEVEDNKEDGASMKTEKCTEKIGYVVVINASDKIKKFSSAFYDAEIMLFDEFQAVQYVPDEVNKWVNIHISIARGNGKATRYLPIIMLSNSLSIVNPYFELWKLSSKIQTDTKLYREAGLSVLRFVNDEVADKQRESRFNIACKDSKILNSGIENTWLYDAKACVCKPEKSWGNCYYIATFLKNENKFGVRLYENGFIYVNRSVDETCTNIYTMSDDAEENVEFAKYSTVLQTLKAAFVKGKARFSDLSCKYDMLNWI